MGIYSEYVAKVEDVFVEGDGRFNLKVIGVSDYPGHPNFQAGKNSKNCSSGELIAKLHYENVNPNDINAIRVVLNGGTVGYLSPEDASLFRQRIEASGLDGIIVSCYARITGGKRTWFFKRTEFELHLDLPIEKL